MPIIVTLKGDKGSCCSLNSLPRSSKNSCCAAFYGVMDPFSVVEFLLLRLKTAASEDWAVKHPHLRAGIEDGYDSLSSLIAIVNDLIVVWPTLQLYLKKRHRREKQGRALEVNGSNGCSHLCIEFSILTSFVVDRLKVWMAISAATSLPV